MGNRHSRDVNENDADRRGESRGRSISPCEDPLDSVPNRRRDVAQHQGAPLDFEPQIVVDRSTQSGSVVLQLHVPTNVPVSSTNQQFQINGPRLAKVHVSPTLCKAKILSKPMTHNFAAGFKRRTENLIPRFSFSNGDLARFSGPWDFGRWPLAGPRLAKVHVSPTLCKAKILSEPMTHNIAAGIKPRTEN